MKTMTDVRVGTILLFGVVLSLALLQLEAEPVQEDVVDQLLAMDAPPPDWRPYVFPEQQPPSDDAPIEGLIAYWKYLVYESIDRFVENPSAYPSLNPKRLSPRASRRFLDACLNDPYLILKALGTATGNSATSESATPSLKEQFSSLFYNWDALSLAPVRDHLVQDDGTPYSDPGLLANVELNGFSQMDWQSAKPALDELAHSTDKDMAITAIAILYLHAFNEKSADEALFRDSLDWAMGDQRKFPEIDISMLDDSGHVPATGVTYPSADVGRRIAFQALVMTSWKGFDDWYISFLSDDLNQDLAHELGAYAAMSPSKWIPIIIQMVDSANPDSHNMAVRLLLESQVEHPTAEGLVPLLPWLVDPNWSTTKGREVLIRSLARVDLPEVVPSLIHLLNQSGGHSEKEDIADALTRNHDPSAIPSLKEALSRETSNSVRSKIIAALVASGAFSDDQMVAAVESFAAFKATGNSVEGGNYGGTNLTDSESVGFYLSEWVEIPDRLAAKVLDRAMEIRKEKLDISATMIAILQQWPVPTSDRLIVTHILDGSASAEMIRVALQRRERIKSEVLNLLLMAADGLPLGIGAALAGTPASIVSVLKNQDIAAQRALLACSRLIRLPLPLGQVGSYLDSPNDGLRKAAELYLENEDSQKARSILLARHSGEAKIFGLGPRRFNDWERSLQKEVLRNNGPQEVYALLSWAFLRSNISRTLHMIIRVWNEKRIEMELPESCRRLKITKHELNELSQWITSNNIENFPPTDTPMLDPVEYEYLHISASGGRRVIMINPGGHNRYDELTEKFFELSKAQNYEIHCPIQDTLKGVQLLYHGDGEPGDADVKEIKKEGDRLMIRVAGQEWKALRNGRLVELGPNQIPASKEEEVPSGYDDAVRIPGNRWMLASRRGESETTMVRVDLETGTEYSVDLPMGLGFSLDGYVAPRKEVLVSCEINEPKGCARTNECRRDYYLVDPGTGKIERASGDFRPLRYSYLRGMHPAKKSDEVWTFIFPEDWSETTIGTYNLRTFTFTPRIHCPLVYFLNFWVDESAQTIYIPYNNSVLSLPIPESPTK